MDNNLNPNNSSIVQILLDLYSISNKNNDLETLGLCDKLLSKLKHDSSLQKQVDDKFNSHKYNDRNMTFSKLENFRNLKIINNLSPNATKILFLIIQTVSQDNLIEIRLSSFMDVLSMSKPTLIKGLTELSDTGAISKIQNKSKIQGSIYMLNPKIASAGKQAHKGFYRQNTPVSSIKSFEELNKNNYQIISSKGLITINENENKYYTFNSLEELKSPMESTNPIEQNKKANEYIDPEQITFNDYLQS